MTPTDRFFIRKGCKWYLDFKSYCTSSSQAHLTLSAMLLYIFLLACALNSTKKKNKTRETDLHPHVTCLSQIELLTLVFKCHIPLQFPLTKADLFFFAHGKKTKKLGSTDECVTAFFHFSFPYVNIVVLEEYHFSRMQEYFSFFLSCQDFPETHTGSDTLAGRLQTVRAAQTRHLWWNELKSLWCRASLWGWFQLLCALQGHPLTASPAKLEMAPVHLPYS